LGEGGGGGLGGGSGTAVAFDDGGEVTFVVFDVGGGGTTVAFGGGGEGTFVVFDDGGGEGGGKVQLSSVSPFPVPGIKEPTLVLPLLHPWQDQVTPESCANLFNSQVHVVEFPPSPTDMGGQD